MSTSGESRTSFFAELKRRRVYNVAAVYVVVGLGVLGAAEVILDPLGLESARPFVVIFTLLGFPIALVLAWAYDITPEGVQRDSGATTATATAAPEAEVVASPPDDKSIAVLPFVDMSPDGDQEYFGDGMAEELLNALAKLPGLRVAARTSTFAFKGREADVQEIGGRLSVATVLEGSIRKSGERVRVTAQLIDATSGYHLWSETYQRELEDVFAIQDEIARSVVGALKVKLLGETEELVDAPTVSLEAYELYMRGRHYWHRRYEVGLVTALDYFERAIAVDPDFALAHAGVADTLMVRFIYGFMEDLHGIRARALDAVKAAQRLDPEAPEVNFSVAMACLVFELDHDGAVEAYREALRARPQFAEAQAWMAITNVSWGHFDEGLAQMREARRMDPVSTYVRSLEAAALQFAGQFEASVAAADAVLAEEPSNAVALYTSGLVLCELGRVEEGVAALERLVDLSDRSTVYLVFLIHGLRRAGRRADAEDVFQELKERLPDNELRGQMLAFGHAVMGRVDDFFREHEPYFEDFPLGPFLLWTYYDDVRDDPRFAKYWAQMGLSTPVQRPVIAE